MSHLFFSLYNTFSFLLYFLFICFTIEYMLSVNAQIYILLVVMNRLGLKFVETSALSHGLHVSIRLLQGGRQVILELLRVHPVKAMLEDGGCAMVAAFDSAHRSVKGGALISAKVSSTVEDVVVIKDGLARLEVDLELARHFVALGIIDGDVPLLRGTHTTVRVGDNKEACIIIQSPIHIDVGIGRRTWLGLSVLNF